MNVRIRVLNHVVLVCFYAQLSSSGDVFIEMTTLLLLHCKAIGIALVRFLRTCSI